MLKSRIADTSETTNTMLEIILDDGDEVIECIENAFIQNNIKKANLVSANGRLRAINMVTTRSGTLRRREYPEPCLIKSVSGDFTRVKENEYMGDIYISIVREGIRTVSGVLTKGIADGEVSIVFKVITELTEGTIYTPGGKKEITMVKEKILEETTPEKPKKKMIIA